MRIRRQLFFYNSLSVLAALVAMLAVHGVVTHAIGRYYQRQADQIFQELDIASRVPEGGAFFVARDGEDLELLIAGPSSQLMPRPHHSRPQAESLMIALLLSGGAAIVVILLLNLLFTRYQLKKLLQPVDALAQAAGRVEAGDFSQAVDYQGRDEFSAVCAAFNRMQEHLLEEQEKNAAYEQARTDLVAGISHDLRTPLTSVKGYIKGLRDGVAHTPEKQQQYLDIAYRRACDMDVLLQRLFYFSRLEAGALPLLLQDADLGEFAARFSAEAGPELEQTGGRIGLTVSPGPHPVSIDPEQMYRLLSNLKDNALRYAGAVPLVLTLTVEHQGEWECIRFADNGRGVSEEALPRLFEQFWREDQARSTQNGEGSGLGLYIVRHIAQAHGGTVQAENRGGLHFIIQLPRKGG